MSATLKCYVTTNADGVWLRSIVMAFAHNEDEARRLIDAQLVENQLFPSTTQPYELKAIPLERGAALLWNGDY